MRIDKSDIERIVREEVRNGIAKLSPYIVCPVCNGKGFLHSDHPRPSDAKYNQEFSSTGVIQSGFGDTTCYLCHGSGKMLL